MGFKLIIGYKKSNKKNNTLLNNIFGIDKTSRVKTHIKHISRDSDFFKWKKTRITGINF